MGETMPTTFPTLSTISTRWTCETCITRASSLIDVPWSAVTMSVDMNRVTSSAGSDSSSSICQSAKMSPGQRTTV